MAKRPYDTLREKKLKEEVAQLRDALGAVAYVTQHWQRQARAGNKALPDMVLIGGQTLNAIYHDLGIDPSVAEIERFMNRVG